MKRDREKALAVRASDGETSIPDAEILVRELLDSRRAALNLMEDAVEAREQAESALRALRESQAELARELADTQRLQKISGHLIREDDFQALYSQIVDAAVALMQSDGASLQMYSNDPEGLHLLAHRGFHPEAAKAWSHISDETGTSCGLALGKNERVVIRDLQAPDSPSATEQLHNYNLCGFRAVQTTPLLSRTGDLVGMISTHWRHPHVPSERELNLFDVLARQAADLIERTSAEESLRASEERFRTLSEAAPALIWFDDAEGNCIYVNQRYVEFSGVDRENLSGKGWNLLLHPDDVDAYIEEFNEAQLQRRSFHARVRARRSDGAWRWLESYAQPLFGSDGTFLGHVGVSPDVTDTVEAESRMRQSRELFLGLVQSAPFGVYLVDSEFRLAQVSRPAQKVFENVNPLIGRDLNEVIKSIWKEPFASEVIETFRQTLETGEEFTSQDSTGPRADIDAMESYEWQVKRITLPDGKFGVVCYFYDMTERRRAEAALRMSEERLRLLTESFHDIAIFTTDITGKVVTWNSGAQNIFGYPDSEIIGEPCAILFTPDDQAAGQPEWEMETARKRGRASDERWHMKRDGSRFYASGIMAPLYEGDQLVGYAKIARDLTSQKQAQEELRRQHEELESIVAGRTAELGEANEALRHQMEERRRIEEERFTLLQKVVTTQEDERRRIARDMHDSLGQQLTALRLKLASMRNEHPNQIQDSLAKLQELGKRIDSEVNFLVWELRPTVLDDLGLVAAIENYVRNWSRHYGIGAEFHAGKFRRSRLAENVETNLYRITQEALNNTYKHGRASNANIVLENRNSELILVIEDDGVGFDPEDVRPQPESARGLGLVGMRERAAIIGGRIEIESAPGSGTTVFVRVPMAVNTERKGGQRAGENAGITS